MIRAVLRNLLEAHAGWEVCGEAHDGREAVKKTAQLKPDLVILDLAMPGMDGLSAAKEIAAASPKLPIVFHTNHASEALARLAKKMGIRQVIGKGAGNQELIDAIEALAPRASRKSEQNGSTGMLPQGRFSEVPV